MIFRYYILLSRYNRMWLQIQNLSHPSKITPRLKAMKLLIQSRSYPFFVYRISLSRIWSVQSRPRERNGEASTEDAMDRGYTATGGYAGGSMGESTPNREDRLFSLAVLFILPSFSLSLFPLAFPSSWRAPCESVHLRLPTLILPRCTCRAHESVERGGRIKLQPGERVLGKVEATLNPFISRRRCYVYE